METGYKSERFFEVIILLYVLVNSFLTFFSFLKTDERRQIRNEFDEVKMRKKAVYFRSKPI